MNNVQQRGPTQVVAGLIWHAGRLLVAQRPRHGACANLWEFPGGKMEAGESPEAALRRELLEELDLVVTVGALAHRVVTPAAAQASGRHTPALALSFYHAWPHSPQAARPLCSQALRWLLPAELPGLAFCPADGPLLALLADGTLRPRPVAQAP